MQTITFFFDPNPLLQGETLLMDCFCFLFAFMLGVIIFMALRNKFFHLFLNPVILDQLRNPLPFSPPPLIPKCGQSLFSF